jgi:catechol 2,3-dioxygenase-like lactoylglutathione lyase family enzyme
MINIVGVGHVSFTVMDLERTIDFYVNKLGGKLFDRNKDEGEKLGKYVFGTVKNTYASLGIAMIKLGNINIEFIQYLDPPTIIKYHGDPSVAGSAHIAWEVDDIEGMFKKLRNEGVKFHSEVNDCIRDNELVWKWVYFRDPDNICVELTQQFKKYE